ncbi:MAG: Flp family type IVb pilin [Pseudomonadota bacterium]
MDTKRRNRGRTLRDVLARFRLQEAGSTAIEYGLIAAFAVTVIIVTLVQLRENLLGLPFPKLLAAFSDALS